MCLSLFMWLVLCSVLGRRHSVRLEQPQDRFIVYFVRQEFCPSCLPNHFILGLGGGLWLLGASWLPYVRVVTAVRERALALTHGLGLYLFAGQAEAYTCLSVSGGSSGLSPEC